MSQEDLHNLYRLVIEDVVDGTRRDFEDKGLETKVVQEKLLKLKQVDCFIINERLKCFHFAHSSCGKSTWTPSAYWLAQLAPDWNLNLKHHLRRHLLPLLLAHALQ